MSALPTNAIIPWLGLHASIPAGFSRETSLDSKFPKAWGVEAQNITGGADTHTHTSPAHTHTMVSHTHTYSLPQVGGTEDHDSNAAGGLLSDEVHSHTGTSGAVSGGTLSDGFTTGSGSSLPPYYPVIFIKATTYVNIPSNGLVYRGDSTEPTGFKLADGNNSTTNLVDKYLRGAATGANSGTPAGGLTHTHTYDHGHTAVNHSHSGAASGGANNPQANGTVTGGNGALGSHTHVVTLDNSSTSVNSATGNFTSGDVEPAYKSLRINQNVSGGSRPVAIGDIVMTLGDPNNLPRGFVLCNGSNGTEDMRDKFVKVKTSVATGGANTHVHTGVASHTHTATASHTHTGSSGGVSNSQQTGAGGHTVSRSDHTHSVTSISSVTPTWNSQTIDASSADNQPAYRTVVYMMLFSNTAGGGFLFNIL